MNTYVELFYTALGRIPGFSLRMYDGATAAMVADYKIAMGLGLPRDLLDFYKKKNGEPETGAAVMLGYRCLPMQEARHQWRQFGESAAAQRTGVTSAVPDTVKPLRYHTRWIPFASDDHDNFLAVDLDPGEAGKIGQIIHCGRNQDVISVISPSFADFLLFCACEFANRQVRYVYDLNNLPRFVWRTGNMQADFSAGIYTPNRTAVSVLLVQWWLQQLRAIKSNCALDLNAPAKRAQLEALAQGLDRQMPAGVQEIYRVANGENHFCGIFFGLRFLSTDEVLAERARFAAADPMSAGFGVQSAMPNRVKSLYTNASWIPFAADGYGRFFALDYDPAADGTAGQVILCGESCTMPLVVASSFDQFLEFIAMQYGDNAPQIGRTDDGAEYFIWRAETASIEEELLQLFAPVPKVALLDELRELVTTRQVGAGDEHNRLLDYSADECCPDETVTAAEPPLKQPNAPVADAAEDAEDLDSLQTGFAPQQTPVLQQDTEQAPLQTETALPQQTPVSQQDTEQTPAQAEAALPQQAPALQQDTEQTPLLAETALPQQTPVLQQDTERTPVQAEAALPQQTPVSQQDTEQTPLQAEAALQHESPQSLFARIARNADGSAVFDVVLRQDEPQPGLEFAQAEETKSQPDASGDDPNTTQLYTRINSDLDEQTGAGEAKAAAPGNPAEAPINSAKQNTGEQPYTRIDMPADENVVSAAPATSGEVMETTAQAEKKPQAEIEGQDAKAADSVLELPNWYPDAFTMDLEAASTGARWEQTVDRDVPMENAREAQAPHVVQQNLAAEKIAKGNVEFDRLADNLAAPVVAETQTAEQAETPERADVSPVTVAAFEPTRIETPPESLPEATSSNDMNAMAAVEMQDLPTAVEPARAEEQNGETTPWAAESGGRRDLTEQETTAMEPSDGTTLPEAGAPESVEPSEFPNKATLAKAEETEILLPETPVQFSEQPAATMEEAKAQENAFGFAAAGAHSLDAAQGGQEGPTAQGTADVEDTALSFFQTAQPDAAGSASAGDEDSGLSAPLTVSEEFAAFFDLGTASEKALSNGDVAGSMRHADSPVSYGGAVAQEEQAAAQDVSGEAVTADETDNGLTAESVRNQPENSVQMDEPASESTARVVVRILLDDTGAAVYGGTLLSDAADGLIQ